MQHNQRDKPEHMQRRLGGGMLFGFWLLLLLMLGIFFHNWLENERNPNQQVESRVTDDKVREVVLKRNRYGHYNLTGLINGHQVEFLLDTGATDIAIPAGVAEELGLPRLREIQFYTANGIARGYATTLSNVRIGDIELHDLRASINPNVDDHIVLLGMSFLKHIEFTQRGDTLTLRQNE